jgi:SAM-dependent methyltransferase
VDIQVDAARAALPGATLVAADIENEPWPLRQGDRIQQFGAVIVTNYLWRPLLETIVESLAPGGVLLYETFADGNETVGRPARADFLLKPGELLAMCSALHVVAYEHGTLESPDRFVQRIAAVRPLNAPVSPGWNSGHAL